MMFRVFLLLVLFFGIANGEDSNSYKVVPIVSSNPTAGTGVGVMGVMMYNADKTSSPSQALISAQYTDTDSYNIFIVNKLFIDSDKWQSNTVYGHIYNNTSFGIDTSEFYLPIDYIKPEFSVTIDAALQQLIYLISDDIYIGGQIFYISQEFEAQNEEGKFFLVSSGIEESMQRGGLGATFSYDTRGRDEKFYPRDSTWINVACNYFPSFFGSDETFYNFLINARKYIPLGKSDDILALQFMGQYCSEDTPDGALAALGMRNILRGFPIGKYKTRYLNAIQSEYRYTIADTRFRLVPFVGYANLSGGSKGTGEKTNRNRDNGDYFSGGAGVHYILDKKFKLDYRVDVAYSSDNEVSVYASINQAF